MADRRRRLLISRREYFRSLLPGVEDEEARRTILAIIEEEKDSPRDSAVAEDQEDQGPSQVA